MDFAHYSDESVDLAVALINTDQRTYSGEDEIDDLASLKTFLDGYKDMWGGFAKVPRGDELHGIHELRDALRSVILTQDEKEASERVNTILAEHEAIPRVSVHTGQPHLHFESRNPTMSSWLAVVTAMGLATVLVHDGLERFGSCRSDSCQDVYVDTSRNRSRRHCSTQCSTREAVAAYRSRR